MKEQWRKIKNYEELYEVSNMGRIRSLRTGRLMTPSPDSDGYATLSLFRNKRKTYRWHKLVLEAFVEDTEKKGQINHKNGNKLDNRLKNLEWVTPSENAKHAYKIGLKDQRGEKNNASKLTARKVRIIRERLSKGESQNKIARDFDISQTTVHLVGVRRLWNY